MLNVANVASRVVFSDGSVDPEAGRLSGSINATAPIVLGLVAPILAMALIDPSALQHAPFLLTTILTPLMVFAVAVYAYCVLNPGEVVGVIADAERRAVELVHANFFASRRTILEFGEISSVKMATNYDEDGYSTKRAELHLDTGERIPLHAVTSMTELGILQTTLGLR